jgi:hypothetical protein
VPRLAVFVSPHGFGHAARAAAVVEAVGRRVAGLVVDLWTTVPEWLFAASIAARFRYRRRECDVGLVQADALTEDLPATVAALESLWGASAGTETEAVPFRDSGSGRRGSRTVAVPWPGVASEAKDLLLKETKSGRRGFPSSLAASPDAASETRDTPWSDLGAGLLESGASAVLCDISPLGLLAARAAGLPAILVENFTWDWIYEGLAPSEPRLGRWVSFLRPVSESATLRLQAEPVCAPAAGTNVRAIPPVARSAKQSRAEVRARLGIAEDRAMVLVSLGGIHSPEALRPVVARARLGAVDFVVPGGSEREERRGSVVLLPHRTPVYHPDLVAAADVVVGKLGYSTVAEAFAAGTRYAYVPRPGFRESAVLERFVAGRLPAVALATDDLDSGAWVERLPDLLARPRPGPGAAGGAEAAAEAIAALL